MPRFLIRFLDSYSLRFHFFVALILGLLFRVVTGYFAYGPLAIDDYNDGIFPALTLIEGRWPEFNIGRSYLLPYLLTAFGKLGLTLGYGVDGAEKVRSMMLGLGALSLTVVLGGYNYARRFDRINPHFAKLLVYVLSLYFVMPFLGTRAFGETVGMGFVMLGMSFLPSAWGFLLLAIASSFRYQIGIILFSCAVIALIQRRRKAVFPVCAGILAFLLLQSIVDLSSARYPLKSFLDHVFINRHGGAEYGSQPWYSHFVLLIGCFFIPFSIPFLDRVPQAIRQHSDAAVSLAAFACVHTLIAHKEERYMAPILPLLLILLVAAWTQKWDSIWVRRLFFPVFVGVHILFLPVLAVSNSQGAMINPIVETQRHFRAGTFFDTNTSLGDYFLTATVFTRPSFHFEKRNLSTLSLEALAPFVQDDRVAVVLAAPEPMNPHPLEKLAGQKTDSIVCSDVQTGSSLTDRLIYTLNPRRNERRRPTHYITCTNVLQHAIAE